jgi:hypothetical protein
MSAVLPAPTHVLARAAWVPTLVIWHADGRFTRLEGPPCADYTEARRLSSSGTGRRRSGAKNLCRHGAGPA